MTWRFLATRLFSEPSPTADLYFADSCEHFVQNGVVSKLAPTVFASAEATLVLRHDAGLSASAKRRRLVYLMDDDIEGGCSDPHLPRHYRAKLAVVDRWAAHRLAPQADAIVVSSDHLRSAARKLAPRARIEVLHPYWREPLSDLAHLTQHETVEIAFLGAQTHARDLHFLLPVIADILDAHPHVRFSVSSGHRLPGPLARHPRVSRIAPIRWTDYRTTLGARRYQLALYPLLGSPFNHGRSVNKIIEHAIAGAAGIYSANWPESHRILAAGAGVVVENDTAAWCSAITDLIADRARLQSVAERGRELADALNRPEPQRALWADLMEFGAGAK